ncbi:hypothetical protein RHSIM_Rhsim06G0180700 [Rhododendron simsii]|uniref:Uncharacterized protein n=1 Tax=Rhododendron simsii TaxID=118357 RepID=A0A834GUS9_RHOSS|nr:hypothetical protein RHSIM_Rhsim06G0180700 [Rhododendron simsii]
MVRTKTVAAKGKGKATTSGREQAEEVVREMEEEEEMIANPERGRSKRRTAAEIRAASQKKWEESLRGRGFKNERHVDVDNLGIGNPFVRRIQEQGLAYYLAPNPGYNKELVIEFYKNMKIPSKEDEDNDDAKISSRIGKVPIEVTSGFIARLLNYRQPPASNVNYPNEEYVADDTIVRELYKNPGEASLPHVPGRFKDVYRLVNQLNVPKSKFVEREKLNPGDINNSILTRSISQSRPATVATPRGAYLTTLPPKGARAASWNKLLFCQGVAIMGCMKKIKKETRDNARRQRRIDHKLDWVVSRGQGQASEPYEPPPMEPDEDSDDFAGGEPERPKEEGMRNGARCGDVGCQNWESGLKNQR